MAYFFQWNCMFRFFFNRVITTLVIILILALPCKSRAQDSLANLPAQWRLEDCIQYAREKNISLATLRLTARSAEEDLLQAKAGVLPNLTASANQSIVNSNNANPVVGGFQTQASFSSSYGLNSSVVLFNGGYLKNDIRSKEFSIQSANLSVKETENDLTLSITQAFFNILLARETIVSLQAVLATSQGQLTQGQQRYDAGAIARKDLLQFQSQVAMDQYNLINAQNTFKLNTVALKQLLLLPSSYNLVVSAPDTIPVKQAQPSLSEAQNEAMQTRPEVKNRQVEIQRSQIELEKAKASVLPTVSLNAGLASGYSDNQSAEYLWQIRNNFYQLLGLSVGIPIYSRRVNRTNINKSKILLQQSQLALLDTKNTLNQEVEQTYINLLNAQAQYDAAQTQLSTSEEIYRITNEQLKLGAVNTVELLQEKNAYVEALQAFTQAKYRAALYNKIYEFYRGLPVVF